MIYDNIKNAERYFSLREDIKIGLEKIKELEKKEPGKYEIDGKKIFASVQEYESKVPEKILFENHGKYIDIQYIISGEEEILTSAAEDDRKSIPYDAEHDVEFYDYTEDHHTFKMNGGDFVILFPGEPHAPGLAKYGKPQKMKKIVVKIMF